jgi:hypothetical protein
LKKLGWTSEDIAAKRVYQLRIMNFVMQAGIHFNNFLLARFYIAIMRLQNDEFASSILKHIIVNAMMEYYNKQPLRMIQIGIPLKEKTKTERENEFEQNFVPFTLINEALSNLNKMNPEDHCSIIKEDFTRFKQSLHSLISWDVKNGPGRGLHMLGEKFNQDKDYRKTLPQATSKDVE